MREHSVFADPEKMQLRGHSGRSKMLCPTTPATRAATVTAMVEYFIFAERMLLRLMCR